MTPLLLLAAIAAAPVVILTILRVEAAIIYLSLCLGEVLVVYVGGDANSLVSAIFPHGSSINYSTMKIVLLILPVLITTIVMIHSVKGSRTIINILPALGVGVLGLVLLEPLLSSGTRGAIESTHIWRSFSQLQTMAVAGSASVSLIFLWMQRKSGHEKSKKHHSKG